MTARQKQRFHPSDIPKDLGKGLAFGFGSLGLGWQPLDWLALKVQWDAHTKFYSGSDFTEVSHSSAHNNDRFLSF